MLWHKEIFVPDLRLAGATMPWVRKRRPRFFDIAQLGIATWGIAGALSGVTAGGENHSRDRI
jgi:hypothetical protein